MRSGLVGSALALLLVPAAFGGIGTASAAGPGPAAPAVYGLAPGPAASPAVELTDLIRCNGNDCNHDGGPNDRQQQWRAQPQPQPWSRGGWYQGQGYNGWNNGRGNNGWQNGHDNGWNNGRGNAWDNDWQNRNNAWNNGWQNGHDNGWNNGHNYGWQNGHDRDYHQNWRHTGQRQACLSRHASHEDCSQLPW